MASEFETLLAIEQSGNLNPVQKTQLANMKASGMTAGSGGGGGSMGGSTPRLDFVNQLSNNILKVDSGNAARVNTARGDLVNYYKNLPSLTDTHSNLRNQQGIPEQENLVNAISRNVMNTQASIDQLEPSVNVRSGDFDINEAKRVAILARERAPLQANMTQLLRSKEYESIGLDQKNALVQNLLSLSEKDQERGARPLQLGVDFTEKDRQVALDLLTGIMGSQVSAFSGDVGAEEARQQAEQARAFEAAMAERNAQVKTQQGESDFARQLALENVRTNNDLMLKRTPGAGTSTEYMRLNREQGQQAAEDTFNNLVAGSSKANEVLEKIKANASTYASQGMDVNRLYSMYASLAARVGATGNIRGGSDKTSQLKDAIMSIPFNP